MRADRNLKSNTEAAKGLELIGEYLDRYRGLLQQEENERRRKLREEASK